MVFIWSSTVYSRLLDFGFDENPLVENEIKELSRCTYLDYFSIASKWVDLLDIWWKIQGLESNV